MRGVEKLRPKRIITIGIALVALVGSGVSAFLIVSPASATSAARPIGAGGGDDQHAVVAGPISTGATYTYYEEDGGNGASLCEVLTFGKKTFTGDGGDAGKFKSTSKAVTVTFQKSGILIPGVFTGTFESADAAANGISQYGGSFKLASGLYAHKTYGPDALVEGNDPWGVGFC